MRRDSGSASPAVLAVLLLLAAALSGLAVLIPTSASYERRSKNAQAEREKLDAAAAEILAALRDDPTPETDSPYDPVWSLAASGVDGVSIELSDISSRLDPNYVRKKLLAETDLEELLAPGATPEKLQQYRQDSGISTSLDHYAEFFPDDSRKRLTGYGWANINTTDEFVLRSLARSLTGSDAKAEALHAKIQGLLAAKKIVAEDDLPGFLGADDDVLEPALSAVPSWNVYFLDSYILKQLLAYPAYKFEDPAAKAAALLSERADDGLTEAKIASTLGVAKGHVLLQYLGCRTWFWEIKASDGRACLTLIAARDPRADRPGEGSRPRFLVIERRYS